MGKAEITIDDYIKMVNILSQEMRKLDGSMFLWKGEAYKITKVSGKKADALLNRLSEGK